MLSAALVRRIESHSEVIVARLVARIREHPDLQHLAKRPDIELQDWCRKILSHLGSLLAARNGETSRQFETLGRMRFEEDVPLGEAVLRCQLLKGQIISFVHEQSLPVSAIELYVERELEERINSFFDSCIYRIVRGYDEARRRVARIRS